MRIITNDSTVINRLPKIVTSHSGMLAEETDIFNGRLHLTGQCDHSLRDTAHTGSHIADHAVADGKDVEHDVHAVSHQGFGGHKADEIVQCRFGAFEFVKVHRILEQRYGEEQHDQRIAYADHGAVKTLHHAPYSPPLKIGGWLSPAPKALSVCHSMWKTHCSDFRQSSFDSKLHLLSDKRNDRLAKKQNGHDFLIKLHCDLRKEFLAPNI